MSPEQKKHLFEWFAAHAAYSLAPDEHAGLQEMLRHDSDARRLWFVHQDVEVGLRARLAAEQAGHATKMPAMNRRKVPLTWRPLAAAAAAVALIVLVVLGWSRRGVEVEVLQTSGAVSEDWVVGQKKRLTHCSLVRGGVQMRLSSGVLLDVSAPMEMTLVNDMHVQVLSGRITADVG